VFAQNGSSIEAPRLKLQFPRHRFVEKGDPVKAYRLPFRLNSAITSPKDEHFPINPTTKEMPGNLKKRSKTT
jgi:hypothetical protein